jgi:hypothetical protein
MGNENSNEKKEVQANYRTSPNASDVVQRGKKRFTFSKESIDFGVDTPCAVGTPMMEELSITNHKANKVSYRFESPGQDAVFTLTFSPTKGSIDPFKSKKVKIRLLMKKIGQLKSKNISLYRRRDTLLAIARSVRTRSIRS